MDRIALVSEGNGFALKRGGEVVGRLTDDDVLSIANNAENLRQTIMTRSYPPGAVFATPVASVLVRSDALGQNVLVQFDTEPHGQTVFQLEYSLGLALLEQLRDLSVPDFSQKPN